MLAHRDYPDHRPLIGSIPLGWKVWLHNPNTTPPKFARCSNRLLQQDRNEHTETWAGALQQSQAVVTQVGRDDFQSLVDQLDQAGITRNLSRRFQLGYQITRCTQMAPSS